MTDNEETTTANIWDLFEGYSKAHGLFEPQGAKGRKVQGKADYGVGAATPADWRRHMRGEHPGIGVVPLLDDGKSVRWAAIDIDDHGIDHAKLERLVDELNLPLALSKSKSDGAHLWAFFSEPVPAALAQTKLTEIAAALGHGGCEIFPKQTTRSGSDPGNWINMPYFGQTRRGVIGGREVKRAAWVEHAWARRMTLSQLTAVRIDNDQPFSDGPPCLEKLFAHGIDEGSRNTIMFNVGVYMRLKHGLDDFSQYLFAFNRNELNDPLPTKEMQNIAKSLTRKEYGYQCSASPLCNHCQPKLCRTRLFGIDPNGEAALDWAYVAGTERYVRRSDNYELKEEALNRLIPKAHKNAPKASDSILALEENRLEGVTFVPKGPRIIGRNFNWWREGVGIPPDPEGDAQPFLEHVGYLFPEEGEHLLDWCAHAVRHPDVRPSFAPLLIGGHGIGKGLIGEALLNIVGQPHAMLIKPNMIKSQFNAWLKNLTLAIVEEVMEMGRKEFNNAIKDYVTAPFHMINPKGINPYTLRNCTAYLMMSNHDDAMAVDPGERRILALKSEAVPRPKDYYDGLFRWMQHEGGYAAIAHYLINVHDLSHFNPKALPVRTEALRVLEESGRSADEDTLRDMFEAGAYPFNGPVVTISSIREQVRFSRPRNDLWFNQCLRGMGGRRFGGEKPPLRLRLPNGGRNTVWVMRDHDRWMNAETPQIIECWLDQWGAWDAVVDGGTEDEFMALPPTQRRQLAVAAIQAKLGRRAKEPKSPTQVMQ